MLKYVFDAVMNRRSAQLVNHAGGWLPAEGALLDIGSGTGHFAAYLERELGLDVVTADVTDMHVTGRAPARIDGGMLPFQNGTFAGSMLVFMLHYPDDPSGTLTEARRVTNGRVLVIQSLYSGRFGYCWLRVREFLWTSVAFHVSRVIGYVPAGARFTMSARRFYTARALEQDVRKAGLRIVSRRERPVLPRRALVVAAWLLQADD